MTFSDFINVSTLLEILVEIKEGSIRYLSFKVSTLLEILVMR